MIDKKNRNDFIEFEKSDVIQMFDDMNKFIDEIEKFIDAFKKNELPFVVL